MRIPQLVDEIHFEDGIYALAASVDGSMIAVGSVGMLGLYNVSEESETTQFSHSASFVLDETADCAVIDLAFSDDGSLLYVKGEDGMRRTLAVAERSGGMLKKSNK